MTRKLDLPLRYEYGFYHPYKVNYSIPRNSTRSTGACIEKSLTHDENVVSHTTDVLESECLEYHQHFSRLPYPLKKECQMLQTITWHPCKAKVGD